VLRPQDRTALDSASLTIGKALKDTHRRGRFCRQPVAVSRNLRRLGSQVAVIGLRRERGTGIPGDRARLWSHATARERGGDPARAAAQEG
jgi:hypothetical protein